MKFAIATAVASLAAVAAAETGICCPFINKECTLKPPMEAECKPFVFGECQKAPSTMVNYYFITTLEGQNLSYRRFSAAGCAENTLESQWSVNGTLGSCLGPIDEKLGFQAYISITKDGANTATTTPAPATTTPAGSVTTATVPATATTTTTPTVTATTTPTTTTQAVTTTGKDSAAGTSVPSMLIAMIAVVSALAF